MFPSNEILVTILARAGSRGCPGKHTRNLCGKPLIAWSIEQALVWGAKHVVVSTDDAEVRAVAFWYHLGVLIIDQQPKPTDTTPKVPAIRHAAICAEDYWQREFPLILDLDATAPLRTSADIDGCLAALQPEHDCLLSATVGVGRNPYWNLLQFKNTAILWANMPINKHVERLRRVCDLDIDTRQEAPAVYEANSSIYVYRREFLMQEHVKSPLDGNCGVYVMPDESFHHVDTELDFELVEFLMKRRLAQ